MIAPTGTIGLVMDCDTTGIEPDFALVKFQEARRRRLFQDHQPRRAGRPAGAGLSRARDRRDRGLCAGPRFDGAGAGHQPADAEGQGLHRRDHRHPRRRHEGGVRHQVRLQQMVDRRGFPRQYAECPRRKSSTTRPSTCLRISASRSRRGIDAAKYPHLRRDDAGRRTASQGRALPGLRLRQSLRARRQALSLRWRAISA